MRKDAAALYIFGLFGFWFFPTKTTPGIMRIVQVPLRISSPLREPPRIAFLNLERHEAKNTESLAPNTPSINLNEDARAESLPAIKVLQHVPAKVINVAPMTIVADRPAPTVEKKAEPAREKVISAAPAAASEELSGPVRFESGAYLADGHIEMKYVNGGITQSTGKINLEKGKYFLPKPNGASGGTVVASMFSGSGEKIGEGRMPMSEAAQGAPLRIQPVENHFALNFLDFNHETAGGKAAVRAGVPAQVFATSLGQEFTLPQSGHLEIANVASGSMGIFRTEQKGYTDVLTLAQAGETATVRMFTEGFIAALLKITADQRTHSLLQENNSVVWGQAISDGSPISDVEILTEEPESSQVVYFNRWLIPDPTLHATSENGYFAVLHLPEGFHYLSGKKGVAQFGFVNVITEPGKVSPVELVSSSKRALRSLRVEDAFTRDPTEVKLQIQSASDSVDTAKLKKVYLPQSGRTGYVVVQPEDEAYATTLTLFNDQEDEIFIPTLKTEWLDKMRMSKEIATTGGTIVGFVDEENYEVYLPHVADEDTVQSSYFDKEGNAVGSPVAGGGFILSNVPSGAQAIVVVNKSSGTAFGQVLPIRPGTTAVIRAHF